MSLGKFVVESGPGGDTVRQTPATAPSSTSFGVDFATRPTRQRSRRRLSSADPVGRCRRASQRRPPDRPRGCRATRRAIPRRHTFSALRATIGGSSRILGTRSLQDRPDRRCHVGLRGFGATFSIMPFSAVGRSRAVVSACRTAPHGSVVFGEPAAALPRQPRHISTTSTTRSINERGGNPRRSRLLRRQWQTTVNGVSFARSSAAASP
jgi:hypothetical protein